MCPMVRLFDGSIIAINEKLRISEYRIHTKKNWKTVAGWIGRFPKTSLYTVNYGVALKRRNMMKIVAVRNPSIYELKKYT